MSDPSLGSGNGAPPPASDNASEADRLMRAHLDFLLGEMQGWAQTNRIPYGMLSPLLREYATRRAALDLPPVAAPSTVPQAEPVPQTLSTAQQWASSFDMPELTARPRIGAGIPAPPLPAEDPRITGRPPVSAPVSPSPNAWSMITAFLEERNIAALHIVGSLLLLTGLLVLIRWQWQGWGRGLLLLMLTALSVGFSLWGRKIDEKQSSSGLVFSALGALILPLDLLAVRLFGFMGGDLLGTDASGLVIAAVCATSYLITLRRAHHPLFGGLTVIALSAAGFFLSQMFFPPPNALLPLAQALTLLPLSYGFFRYAARSRQKGDIALARPFTWGGHSLIALTLILSLTGGLTDNHRWAQSIVALLASILYADIAVRLRIPRLTFAAAFCIVLSSQLAFGMHGMGVERGCALALAAFALEALGMRCRWQAAHSAAEEMQETLAEAGTFYSRCGLWLAWFLLLPFVVASCVGLMTFTLSASGLRMVQYLAAGLLLGGVFVGHLWQEGATPRRRTVYSALAALFISLVALGGLIGSIIPPIAPWFAPAACSLVFTLLCMALADAARKAGVGTLANLQEEVVQSTVVLTALLPWAFLPGLMPHPPTVRILHLVVIFPVLALLCGLRAMRSDSPNRTHYRHLALLALGSFSLYIGASVEGASLDQRLLWSALGGAIMAGLFVLAAAFRKDACEELSQDAALLAGITLLPLVAAYGWPLYGSSDTGFLLAKAGIGVLLTVTWAGIARQQQEPTFLYGAGIVSLLTVGWVSSPLETAVSHWPQAVANPTRWFIYFAPLPALLGYGLRARQKENVLDYAQSLLYTALGAAIIGGLGQMGMIGAGMMNGFAGTGKSMAQTGIAHLYLLGIGFAACGVLRRQVRFIYAAEVALLAGYLPCLLASFSSSWSFSPYITALALTLVGIAALYTVQVARLLPVLPMDNALPSAQIGALFLLAANAHLLFSWLPAGWHYAWAVLLLPLMMLLAWIQYGLLKRTIGGAGLVLLSIFTIDLLRWHDLAPSLMVARGFLAFTFPVYAMLYFFVSWREDRTNWFIASIGVMSAGVLLWRSGFPEPTFSLESLGLHLAILGGFWFGIGYLLARSGRPAFETVAVNASLVMTVAAMVSAVVSGFAYPTVEYLPLLTLLVSGAVQTTIALRRPDTALRHLAFASFFAASSLWLYHHLGISLQTMDLMLLPLGLYLLCIGGYDLYRQRRTTGTQPKGIETLEEARALQVCGLGLSLLLGPSLLATWSAGGAWWHPFLLVTESLAAIAAGIGYRLKLFLGFGFGFLVALLGIKAYQAIQTPGQQLLFALYLLLLGGLALAVGFFFDRRRGLLRSTTQD